MMNLGRADIEQMSLYEYQARLYHWNKIHRPADRKGKSDPSPVPHYRTQMLIDHLNAHPELLGPKPPGFGDAEFGGPQMT